MGAKVTDFLTAVQNVIFVINFNMMEQNSGTDHG